MSLTTAPILLSDAVPTRRERRVALSLMGVLGLAFIVAIPIASVPIGEVPTFIPAYDSALFLCDLITGTLLAGQYLRSHLVAVLELGGAFLFNSLLIVPHMLTYVGVLGGGLQIAVTHQVDFPYVNGEPTVPIGTPCGPPTPAPLQCQGLGNQGLPAGIYNVTTSVTLGLAQAAVSATTAASDAFPSLPSPSTLASSIAPPSFGSGSGFGSISPSSLGTSPQTMEMVVVLPAPFGPRRP